MYQGRVGLRDDSICSQQVSAAPGEQRQRSHSSSRTGFTVLELLVTCGIIGTLMSLILPAVGSAREAARQLQCKNQLKQVGIALHSYHETHRCLPAGWQFEATHQSLYGWSVPLLPYLEQRAIYTSIDRNRVLEHPANLSARKTSIASFLCPSDIFDPTFLLYPENPSGGAIPPIFELPTGSYVGVYGTVEADDGVPPPPGDGALIHSQTITFAHLQRGLSNTLLVGERTMSMVPSTWLGVDAAGEDAACRLLGSAMTSPNCKLCDECEFSSRHPGGTNFLWGDGRVRFVSDSIDSRTYQQMARRLAQ
ncbi:hypothetical protein Pan153_44780 [Gimesia panareensis]|uniref:DUF1559 domain-containing protein n=1 Tax=Gimesia panareensis TaxID=2527978 RepID=A0A518FTZ8_9PLAN|nr:DUF1559 domain-containing protein [Gimesia panareensis]QDV19809.1 hypothetical protein Pan153_44780 [Gimesia panareensis]